MKKSLKWKLIGILAAILSLFLLAGCSFSQTLEEIRQKYGLTAQVTYYTNGGLFGTSAKPKTLYLKPGQKAAPYNKAGVTYTSGADEVKRTDYNFDDWYFADLDENGQVQYLDEAQTQIKIDLENPVDFSVALQDNEIWHIGANWNPNVKVNVQLVVYNENNVLDTESEITYDEDKSAKNGDTIGTRNYEQGKATAPPTKGMITPTNGYTFVQYYSDISCAPDKALDWKTLSPKDENEIVYAKFIKGNWTIVSTANDVKTMFTNQTNASKKFYVANDIDCTDTTVLALTGTMERSDEENGFAATLIGNNAKISNLKVQGVQFGKNGKTAVSLFGHIKDSAVMKDITFEDMSLTYTAYTGVSAGVQLYFAFSSISTSAKIDNVTLDGDIKYTLNSTFITNETNWKYGAIAESDYTVDNYGTAAGFTVTATSTRTELEAA